MTIVQLMKELRLQKVVMRLDQDKLLCELPSAGISSSLRAELVARKEEIKAYIASSVSGKPTPVVIPKRPMTNKVATSYAQESLWMLDQFNEGSAHYNMPNALKLSGELNVPALNKALTTIFERHETIRTYFGVNEDGLPVQIIKPSTLFEIPIQDVSHLDLIERDNLVKKIINDEAARSFDLSKDDMLRVLLLKVSDREHMLSVTMHHIASDGWSITILIKEFAKLYAAYCQGLENPLAPIEVQYADYAHWQREWLQKAVLNDQLQYWEKQLENLPEVHGVPLDYSRPVVQSTSGDVYNSLISPKSSASLNKVCHQNGATLYMGLHAAFSIFLSRYSNERDIVIGTAVANREQAELTQLIGYFINVLVLRSDLSGEPNFVDLIKQSKSMLLDAYSHQQVPFSQVIDRMLTQGSLSYSPLCQIMLILQNTEEVSLELPNLKLSTEAFENKTAKHDLTLYVTESDSGLELSWEYNSDLFKRTTIKRMAKHFAILLDSLLECVDQNVFTLDMLSEIERNAMLQISNGEQTDFPDTMCVHELFEQQVAKTPNKTAIEFEGKSLSYAALNASANQLARYLLEEKSLAVGSLVGIHVERSLDMIVSIFATLKAGCTYVPLDPDYPKSRIEYMLDDAQLAMVITQSHLQGSADIPETLRICLDSNEMHDALLRCSVFNVEINTEVLNSSNNAYVIYTSGSTGKPKGVVVGHQSLVNLVVALNKRYQLSVGDTVLQFAPISFDMSVEEIFPALCAGARLVIRNNAWLDSIDIFYEKSRAAGITVMNLPTAFWHELARDETKFGVKSVRHISIGGEKISQNEVQRWFDKESNSPVLCDAYGPTEATVNASLASVNKEGKEGIGKPVDNVSLFVLNSELQLAPINVSGELHIGGLGLAKGYLNRPELTVQKFIENPFSRSFDQSLDSRLYKTGDLVRRLENGCVEYLGRVDHQVKIRGFRIELGEIEKALLELPQVSETLVSALRNQQDANQLVAYVVLTHAEDSAEKNEGRIIEGIRLALGRSLPNYMIPTFFIPLTEFPLTSNGKIDLKSLPNVEAARSNDSFIAPTTDTEIMLSEIWCDVLNTKAISCTDNFFALGGNSLLAIRALSKIKQSFGEDLSIRSLFMDPSIKGISTLIETIKLNKSNLQVLNSEELVEEGFF